MEGRSPSKVIAAVAAAVILIMLSAMAIPAASTSSVVIEHTFVVSQMKMTHLCKETLVPVVNGQLPGPPIEVTEGDAVAIHVVNRSPYNITIHWHGVKQMLNCWADGVPMITQCPILPNDNFTYRFDIVGKEGTLWWHAHVASLRGTLHGALIIRPRHLNYPFPKPHREIPVIIGDWWEIDLAKLERDFVDGDLYDRPSASTINGRVGDLFNCSGAMEEGYMLDVEPGKTYLLRVINAALFSEYYVKIAGHKFTVVAADANYVKPYTTDIIAIAPGETVDALVVAGGIPGRSYYIVAKPVEFPPPDPQIPAYTTRGTLRYNNNNNGSRSSSSSTTTTTQQDKDDEGGGGIPPPVLPDMPDPYDMMTSFYFHGNLTSLQPQQVPNRVDEHLYVALSIGTVCRRAGNSCKRGVESYETIQVATLNNVSFQLPVAAGAPSLLEAHYYHRNDTAAGVDLYTLPDRPPRMFNFTDPAIMDWGPEETPLEPTERATAARRFRYGAAVEVVFQSTALLQGDANPMHLHGYDVFVLAQGLGNYDATRHVARYNLVDPPLKNTVLVPRLGWVALRFVADNPGIWYMHCHFEFHMSMGMTALFIVEDGPTVDTSLPAPPAKLPACGHSNINNPVAAKISTSK